MLLNLISAFVIGAVTLSPQDVKLEMAPENPTYYPGEPIPCPKKPFLMLD